MLITKICLSKVIKHLRVFKGYYIRVKSDSIITVILNILNKFREHKILIYTIQPDIIANQLFVYKPIIDLMTKTLFIKSNISNEFNEYYDVILMYNNTLDMEFLKLNRKRLFENNRISYVIQYIIQKEEYYLTRVLSTHKKMMLEWQDAQEAKFNCEEVYDE